MIPSYKKIAVAIDFSEQSKKALARAIEMAKMSQATLLLVNVVDTKSFGSIPAYDLKYADELAKKNEKMLEGLKEEVLQAGVSHVEVAVEKGSPKKILTELADVNLVVCGATGLSRVQKFVLGSVAERIVRYSKYDVLIVRD